jgi:hypothetical protein
VVEGLRSWVEKLSTTREQQPSQVGKIIKYCYNLLTCNASPADGAFSCDYELLGEKSYARWFWNG